MSAAADLCAARLKVEEAVRRYAYDDSTGGRVTCLPRGNLSIGCGINLEEGLDPEESDWLTAHRLGKEESGLLAYDWYRKLDVPRKSVLLDMAFNLGLSGVVHGFPNMIRAIEAFDWPTAAHECHLADTRLAHRYAVLANILLTGNA